VSDTTHAVERVFRQEHGRVLSILIGSLGDFDLAEDALQETFVTALERWPRDGLPDNPAAWMVTVGRRKAIDRLRREKALTDKTTLLSDMAAPPFDEPEAMDETAIPDERLKLIFTCCHPALAPEARLALTLRTLGGLDTAEIARAFLVSVPTMNQRITRAKAKIRHAGIPYDVPPVEAIPERLDSVLHVLYLIFNEGYTATAGDDLIRRELCAEAIRLATALVELLASRPDLGQQPEAMGLLALMLLHDSRRAARVDADGEIILLEDQDRVLWDQAEIDAGSALLERALAVRRPGPYQIQAAVAALHAEAGTAAQTDWKQIVALYGELMRHAPSPVVRLNKAVAVGMARGPLAGLALLQADELEAALRDYHWYHAAVADFLRRAGYREEARTAYVRALALCENRAERSFLVRRIAELSG
jgi:RNA polymerase sigma-70 factor (ECF subfamily)